MTLTALTCLHTMLHILQKTDSTIQSSPVYTQGDQYSRRQIVPQCPHHHQQLAGYVVSMPLHGVSPKSLQWHGDKGNDGVRNCEMKHKVVNIGTGSEDS